MPGKITIKKSKPTMIPYVVQGSTLQEIWTDIQAKGPTDDGKSRAGYTKADVTTPASYDFDGKVKPNKGKGVMDVEVWIKTGTFDLTADIKIPKLKSDKDLSPAARKEWARFMKELLSHEMEHVAATEKEARKFADEMLKLKGKGSDADKEKAKQLAAENFSAEQAKKHSNAEFKKRLKAANKALDSSGHGPVLKTSIP